jgi:hypothetical protein
LAGPFLPDRIGWFAEWIFWEKQSVVELRISLQEAEKKDLFPIGESSSAILDAVRVNELVARADLPAPTGLSQQTVHRLTEDLLERGFLERKEPVIQGRGKPSPRLAVNPAGAYGFGVSVDTNSVETV